MLAPRIRPLPRPADAHKPPRDTSPAAPPSPPPSPPPPASGRAVVRDDDGDDSAGGDVAGALKALNAAGAQRN
eukprot:gene1477-3662_t